ncbi:hypothetical protein ACJX0J_027672, partial [Zea mays]
EHRSNYNHMQMKIMAATLIHFFRAQAVCTCTYSTTILGETEIFVSELPT